MGTKPRDRFYSNPGQRYAETHHIIIDDRGHKTLTKTGEKTDTWAKIRSHADECDIHMLLMRCDAEGYQVLDQKEAIYGDLTVVPKSYMEAQQLLQEQENKFNQLPIEIRKKFNFSFSEYIAESSENIKSWASKMGIIEEAATADPEPQPEPSKEGGNE